MEPVAGYLVQLMTALLVAIALIEGLSVAFLTIRERLDRRQPFRRHGQVRHAGGIP
jgi:hypothetical protein